MPINQRYKRNRGETIKGIGTLGGKEEMVNGKKLPCPLRKKKGL
jgi:hypothetical protein